MTVPPLNLDDAVQPWQAGATMLGGLAFMFGYAYRERRSKALQRFNQWWAL